MCMFHLISIKEYLDKLNKNFIRIISEATAPCILFFLNVKNLTKYQLIIKLKNQFVNTSKITTLILWNLRIRLVFPNSFCKNSSVKKLLLY